MGALASPMYPRAQRANGTLVTTDGDPKTTNVNRTKPTAALADGSPIQPPGLAAVKRHIAFRWAQKANR